MRTTLLWAIAVLAGCSGGRALEPSTPRIEAAPPFKTGYYTVHTVRNGRPAKAAGAEPFGELVYLSHKEFVKAGLRYMGVGGAFLPDGRFRSEPADNRIRHLWETGKSNQVTRGEFVIDSPPDAETLTLWVGERATARRVALRFVGRRLPGFDVDGIAVAHRGTAYQPPTNHNGVYPANTIPAFEAALSAGYQGFELDVRVTKDGKFVVSHDSDLSVATDCDGEIGEKTLDELRKCRVQRSTSLPEVRATAATAKIAAPLPSLAQVAERFLRDARLEVIVVDVKPDTVEALVAATRDVFGGLDADAQRKLLFLMRSEDAIRALRKVVPGARYALEGPLGTEPLRQPEIYCPESVGKPRGAHDTISISARLMMTFSFSMVRIDASLRGLMEQLEKAHKYDYKLIAWSISNELRMDLLRKAGFFPDYAMSDAPYERIARQFLKYRQESR